MLAKAVFMASRVVAVKMENDAGVNSLTVDHHLCEGLSVIRQCLNRKFYSGLCVADEEVDSGSPVFLYDDKGWCDYSKYQPFKPLLRQ